MIVINEHDKSAWCNQKSGQIFIAEEEHHRNSELFLTNFTSIKENITKCLNSKLNGLEFKVTKDKRKPINYKRLGANSLNRSLKKQLSGIDDIKFEVEYKDGILFDSPKTGGFDFAIYDTRLNVNKFRNFCFGRQALYQGEALWEEVMLERPEWLKMAQDLKLPKKEVEGEDLFLSKSKPTIIGEIQFGNWALAYYDLFKVLHLDNLTDIDLLVYITATGNLNEYLSDGIVNYKDGKEILQKYNSILKVPIWLIGLDIK